MKIIFHYAGEQDKELNSGEKVRVNNIKQGFSQLGIDLIDFSGNFKERCDKIKNIADLIKNKEVNFIYSESRTIPIRLTNKYKIPIINSPDIKLFKTAKKYNVPIGVFYRDIYWQYKTFIKEIGIIKYLLSIPFYIEEIMIYNKYSNKIFVPSKEFIENTIFLKKNKMKILPPGCNTIFNAKTKKITYPIKLVYVGSIKPPIYDITPLLKEIEKFSINEYKLTICTRKTDMQLIPNFYKKIPDNIEIINISGKELEKVLLTSDIFVILFKETKYRKICMPIKLFEAINFELPIITNGINAASNFIEKNSIGWNFQKDNDIFKKILKKPQEELEKIKQNIKKIKNNNSWKYRVKMIINELN